MAVFPSLRPHADVDSATEPMGRLDWAQFACALVALVGAYLLIAFAGPANAGSALTRCGICAGGIIGWVAVFAIKRRRDEPS